MKKILTFTKVQDDYYFMSVFPKFRLESFKAASRILARNGSTIKPGCLAFFKSDSAILGVSLPNPTNAALSPAKREMSASSVNGYSFGYEQRGSIYLPEAADKRLYIEAERIPVVPLIRWVDIHDRIARKGSLSVVIMSVLKQVTPSFRLRGHGDATTQFDWETVASGWLDSGER